MDANGIFPGRIRKSLWSNLKVRVRLYVSFVSLPIFSHFEPLAAMAEEMFNRGYRKYCYSRRLWRWVERYAPNAQFIPCGGVPDNEDLEEPPSDATHQLRITVRC